MELFHFGMLEPFLQQNPYLVETSLKWVPFITQACTVGHLQLCSPWMNRPMAWWSASRSAAGAWTAETLMWITHTTPITPHPHAPSVHAVSNTLYWSLEVIDLMSSHTAATVPAFIPAVVLQFLLVLLVVVAVPWIACIVCCPHLPDSQHIIWCSPLAWCSSARLSPSLPTSCQPAHLITAPDIVLHASLVSAVNGLLCLQQNQFHNGQNWNQ